MRIFLPVESRVVDTVFDVGEHGLAHREVRRCFKVQQARQHATVAAGIEHEVGLDAVLATVFAKHVELWFRQAEIGADNGFAITDIDTLQRSLIGQQLVEVGALDLERRRLAVGERVAEIEGAVLIAPSERRPVFLRWKPAAFTASSMPASSTKSRQWDSRLSPMENRGKCWRSIINTS